MFIYIILLSSCSWISVLTNSKEEALNMAFRGEQSSGGEDGLEDLTKAIIEDVLRMPGNEVCCDCGAAGEYCSFLVSLRLQIQTAYTVNASSYCFVLSHRSARYPHLSTF